MKTIPVIDFLAPLPRIDWNMNLGSVPATFPPSHLPPLEVSNKIFHPDAADRFTYIILGLAVCIAILIPLLNWN